MGAETGIAWTDHTANFWMGCQRVSPGCERCYAETLVTNRMGLKVWGPASTTERKRTASARVGRVERAVAEAEAALKRAREHAVEVMAATTRMRARLARKGTE